MILYDCCEAPEDLKHDEVADAVDEFLSDHEMKDWPTTLHVKAYQRKTISESYVNMLAEWALEHMLETLYDEYGGDDMYDDKPTQAMVEASKVFAKAIAADYVVWQCERAPEFDDHINLVEWLENSETTEEEQAWIKEHK